MDLPKCRICGEKHRLGGCPSSIQRAPKSRPEAQKVEQPRELRGKDAGSIPAGPPTKPAKKAKPKKKGKINGKAKKTKSGSSRKHKGRSAGPDIQGNGAAQSIAAVDVSQDLPASAGNVAQLAAGQIKVGPPRKGEEHKTLTATKPWEKLGMSRPSWYRKGKPAPEDKR